MIPPCLRCANIGWCENDIFFYDKRKSGNFVFTLGRWWRIVKKPIPTFFNSRRVNRPRKPRARASHTTVGSSYESHSANQRYSCKLYKRTVVLSEKSFFSIHFHIWDTRSPWRVHESKKRDRTEQCETARCLTFLWKRFQHRPSFFFFTITRVLMGNTTLRQRPTVPRWLPHSAGGLISRVKNTLHTHRFFVSEMSRHPTDR